MITIGKLPGDQRPVEFFEAWRLSLLGILTWKISYRPLSDGTLWLFRPLVPVHLQVAFGLRDRQVEMLARRRPENQHQQDHHGDSHHGIYKDNRQ